MTATAPTTFLDLKTDGLQRVRETTTGTTALDIMGRYLNQALHDVHLQQNWPWSERRAVLQTAAKYATGTISTSTSARTTVTGASTVWTTSTGYGRNNVAAGDKIVLAGATDVYSIASVGGAGTLTLNESWVGATALSGSTYYTFTDEYALPTDYWRHVDQRIFTTAMNVPILSRQEFYRRYVRNSTPSQPQVATIIDLAPSSSTARQPRVVFHPPPDLVYNLPYRYITTNLAVSTAGAQQTQMSADTDEPIIPLRYRHMLVFYAIAEWYRDRKDDARSGAGRQAYEDLLRRAANDTAPERDHPRITFRSPQRMGVAGFPRGTNPRFSTGSRFDEMRD